MKVLLVSFGSIARKHLATLRQLVPAIEVTILRRAIDPELSESQVDSLAAALAAKPEAALICSPAPQHIAIARELAAHGIPLFIEKPISHTTEGVVDLLAFARENEVPILVGYTLRFFEPLRVFREALQDGKIGRLLHLRAEVGQYLPDWRPGSDYREGVTARAGLGGGALLELSHEIDYVRWLAGEVTSVSAQIARVSDLEIETEDCADLHLRFASGVLGSIHLDLLQRTAHRACRAVGSEGTLTLNFLEPRVRLYSAAANEWTDLYRGPIPKNGTYLNELGHFLSVALREREPLITGEDGLRALEIVEAARQSSAEGRTIVL